MDNRFGRNALVVASHMCKECPGKKDTQNIQYILFDGQYSPKMTKIAKTNPPLVN